MIANLRTKCSKVEKTDSDISRFQKGHCVLFERMTHNVYFVQEVIV